MSSTTEGSFVDHPVLPVADQMRARQIIDVLLFEAWPQLPRRFAPGTGSETAPLPDGCRDQAAHGSGPRARPCRAWWPDAGPWPVTSSGRDEPGATLTMSLTNLLGPGWCWHQDRTLSPTGLLERAVHFWVPLHDVAPEGGGMMFVPRSEVPDLLPHELVERSVGVKTKVARLATPVEGVTKALPLGGLSAHGPRTLHGSASNSGTSVRKAWIL